MKHRQDVTGLHDGLANAVTLTDSGESYVADEFNGLIIDNITDGSAATITDNTGTTVVGTLVGGTDADWDISDAYKITYWEYSSIVSKIYVPSQKCHMALQVALAMGLVQLSTKANSRRFTFTNLYDRQKCYEPCIG